MTVVVDWMFLSLGGFLLGVFFYCGYFTTRFEPSARPGYFLAGAGMILVVVLNTWVDFTRDISDWFRLGTLLGYVIIAAGLGLIVYFRRKQLKQEGQTRFHSTKGE